MAVDLNVISWFPSMSTWWDQKNIYRDGKTYQKKPIKKEVPKPLKGPGEYAVDDMRLKKEKLPMKKAAFLGFGQKPQDSQLEALYRNRILDKVLADPKYYHPLATGQSAPLTATIGNSTLLPLIAMMIGMKKPMLGAALTGGQALSKMIYDLSTPKKLLQNVATAKALKNPDSLYGIMSAVPFEAAAKPETRVNLPSWHRLLNLGF